MRQTGYVRALAPREVPPREIVLPPPVQIVRPKTHTHSIVIYCEQKWRWRVYVKCHLCDYVHMMPGAWWKKSDADEMVERTLMKLRSIG